MARIETIVAAQPPTAPEPARPRWRIAHDVFLKIMAIAHLGWALWEWAAIMGIVPPIDEPGRTNLPRQGAALFFAAFDPVAAVGLWLGSTWGTATWLVVTFARILIHTGYAGIFGWTGPWTIAQVAAVAIYLALFFLAERADREAKKRRRRMETA
ncbi:MAG: DUF6163 family protein [Siculibacillus sp.]|nr:DUF6163 family protein [Siculibacillus sp.]